VTDESVSRLTVLSVSAVDYDRWARHVQQKQAQSGRAYPAGIL
jgi:hypothetical protein